MQVDDAGRPDPHSRASASCRRSQSPSRSPSSCVATSTYTWRNIGSISIGRCRCALAHDLLAARALGRHRRPAHRRSRRPRRTGARSRPLAGVAASVVDSRRRSAGVKWSRCRVECHSFANEPAFDQQLALAAGLAAAADAVDIHAELARGIKQRCAIGTRPWRPDGWNTTRWSLWSLTGSDWNTKCADVQWRCSVGGAR